MSHKYVSGLGLLCMLIFAWLLSPHKRCVNLKLICGGLFLQLFLAFIILKTGFGQKTFTLAKDAVEAVIGLSDEGARFVFGETFKNHFFAFKVLPTIIFVSSLSYLLFYFGLIQKIISLFAWVMQKFMNVSGVDGLAAAANIFLGQTEAPLFVKPYLKTMTISEIHTLMTTGMATVAGGVLAAYVGFGISAGHLLAASLMSAPAALLVSKLVFPETEKSLTKGQVKIELQQSEVNAFEAACVGASAGLNLALNVGAMLIAFMGLVALTNLALAGLGHLLGLSLSLEQLLALAFQPLAFLLGVPWQDCASVGRLLGERMVLNEFIAYMHLAEHIQAGHLSSRSVTITTYALCGFANFSSIAIQIGGLTSLEPSRRPDYARCGFKSMLAGTLASFMTACIAGMFID